MSDFSKIMQQVKLRQLELEARKIQLQDLVVDITEEERERVINKSAKDFFYFAKKVFPEYCTYPFSDLHRDIHSFSNERERLVHCVYGPPESGKTSIMRVEKIWQALYKKHYIIKITETMALTLVDLESIRLEFEQNPRIRFLYGDLKTTGRWDQEAFKIAPTTFNKRGCWFEGFAFDKPPTGRLREEFRPDLADIDDLENYKRSGNIKISREKLQFINNDVIPRMANDAPIIWFGNNARKTMASNIIVEMEEQQRKYEYPAFRIHLYPAFNRRTKKALWKERYDFDDEEKMRLSFGVGMMTWQGNYMQNPVVPEGTEFKRAHWREYKRLPDDAYGIIMCDPAGGKKGAFKAAVLFLYSQQTRKFYVHRAFVRQCDWEEYFNWMYDTYHEFHNRIRYIGWEKDFHQDQFLLFMQLYPSTKDKPPLPVFPLEVKGQGKKDERIRTLAVPYETGQILYNEEFLLTPDGREGQTQVIGFPDYSFKDFPDCEATAYKQVYLMFAGGMMDELPGQKGYQSVDKLRTSRSMF